MPLGIGHRGLSRGYKSISLCLCRGYKTPGRGELIVLRTKEGMALYTRCLSCAQRPSFLRAEHAEHFSAGGFIPPAQADVARCFNGLSTALQRCCYGSTTDYLRPHRRETTPAPAPDKRGQGGFNVPDKRGETASLRRPFPYACSSRAGQAGRIHAPRAPARPAGAML